MTSTLIICKERTHVPPPARPQRRRPRRRPSTSTARLFGTEPAKVRPGYANFAVAEPPLKLVLIENPGQGGSLNHLGVEVEDVDTVDAEPDPPRRSRARLGRRARHHLLLRQAGQVLGRRHAQRRGMGDLHRPGRQPHAERRGRQDRSAAPAPSSKRRRHSRQQRRSAAARPPRRSARTRAPGRLRHPIARRRARRETTPRSQARPRCQDRWSLAR